MSAAIVAKDKELENFREDEFSDSTHHTRQNRYKKENDSLCSDIEALRKKLLKSQEDLDMTTRNRNELEYEIQALRTTLRKNSAIMETQRVDLGTYKIKYNERASTTMLLLNSTRFTARSWREIRELRLPNKPTPTSELRSIVLIES